MKKRPICLIAIGLIFGILGGQYLPEYGPLFFGYIIIGVILFWVIISKKERNFLKRIQKLFSKEKIFILILITSIILGGWYSYAVRKQKYDWNISEEEVVFVGEVLKREQEDDKQWYLIKLDSINGKRVLQNISVKILIYQSKDTLFPYGSTIQGKGTWKEFRLASNEYGFDEKLYQMSQGVTAKIQAKRNDICIISLPQKTSWKNEIRILREKCVEKIEKKMGEKEAGLADALLLGDKGSLSAEAEEIFQDSSLAHLVAISGSHVSIVLGVLQKLWKKGGKRSKKLGFILFVCFFSILAGESYSVQRACICTGLSLVAGLCFRKSDPYQNLGISIIILIIQNPFCIFDVGLQLSYLGTLAILFSCRDNMELKTKEEKEEEKLEDKRQKQEEKQEKERRIQLLRKMATSLKKDLYATVFVNFVILPILISSFHKLSFAFLFSGILLNPLLTIILLLGYGILVFSFGNLDPLWWILEQLLKIFNVLADKIAHIPGIVQYFITPKPQWICIYFLVGILVFIATKKEKKRIQDMLKKLGIKLVCVLVCINCVWGIGEKCSNSFQISFLDVGQGDCCLVQTEDGTAILIDGGGNFQEEYNTGKMTVLPYLLSHQISKIDIVILSHFDVDHSQGIIYLLDKIPIGQIVIGKQPEVTSAYEEFVDLVQKKKIPVKCQQKGDEMKIDDHTSIQFLWPSNKVITENAINNNALVFRLNYRNQSVMFCGDIEQEAENALIQEYTTKELKADILKVAHHGSKTSSTESFLKLVNPQIALIGVRRE